MGFVEQWKAAKKQFEDATGKKKPSASFNSAFSKATGLEGAAKALDEALKKLDAEAILKAETAWSKAAESYAQVLQKHVAAEKSVDLKSELTKLKLALDDIFQAWVKAKGEALRGQAEDEVRKLKARFATDALEAKQFATATGRDIYNKAEETYTGMHQQLATILELQQSKDVAGIKKTVTSMAKDLKALEGLAPQLLKDHARLAKIRSTNRALNKAYTEKHHVGAEAANWFEKYHDPFIDQIEVLADKIKVEFVPKAQEVLRDATAAIKGSLDASQVVINLVFAMGARVKTLHDQLYARVAAMDKFTQFLGDYDNAKDLLDPVQKKQEFALLNNKIVAGKFPEEAAQIKDRVVQALKVIYPEMSGLVTKARGIPKASSDIDEIRKLIGKIEAFPDDADNCVRKILGLQAKIPK